MSKDLTLKKHVSAIHIKGELSLLQRKLMNALLFNAYEELIEKPFHTISLAELGYLSGFDSKDQKILKEAARGLVSKVIEWDLMEDSINDEESWNISTCLASLSYKKRSGNIEYSYSEHIKMALYNPEIYAIISLSLQRRFSSKYSIALYENCLRYHKIGQTPWFDIEKIKSLLGVEKGKYSDYQAFRRRVLVSAIADINESTDIEISVKTKKEGRKIAFIKFIVKKRTQAQLDFDVAGETPLKQILIRDFALTEKQALEISSLYDEDRIERNLDYVRGQIDESKHSIKALGAYTYKAIKEDYRPPLSSLEQRQIDKKEEDKKTVEIKKKTQAKEEAEREAKAQAYSEELNARLARFWALPAEKQEELSLAFRGKLRSGVQKEKFDTGGLSEALKSKLVETEFKKFLEANEI